MVKASAYSAGDLSLIPGLEDPWRRKWQPTPVLLPRKSHGQRSLIGYSPWDRSVGHDWVTSLSLSLCSGDITLPTKVHLVKAKIFPVVMYRCDSWTIKKAECWRIEAFDLWCWSRLLKVLWTAKRSNQSMLKEINPDYSLEGLLLRWSSNILATWFKEPSHWKRPWLKAKG